LILLAYVANSGIESMSQPEDGLVETF
jgi:hypothetical protein